MRKIKTFLFFLVVFGAMGLTARPAIAATTYYVNYSFLNIRAKPNANSKRLGRLYYGDRVSVGKLSKGWAKIRYKGKKAYLCAEYLTKVKACDGWKLKGGYWDYYKNGVLVPSAYGTHEAYTKIAGSLSGSNYYIAVNRSLCMMYVFKAVSNEWTPYKQFACSVGKSSTPTPKGKYSINSKQYRLDSVMPDGKSTEFYGLSFKSDYCIHSTLYKYGAGSPKAALSIDTRLGYQISNGCIRVSTSNCKWLYDNTPSGTAIYIY